MRTASDLADRCVNPQAVQWPDGSQWPVQRCGSEKKRAEGNAVQRANPRGTQRGRAMLRVLWVASNRMVDAHVKGIHEIGKSRASLARATAWIQGQSQVGRDPFFSLSAQCYLHPKAGSQSYSFPEREKERVSQPQRKSEDSFHLHWLRWMPAHEPVPVAQGMECTAWLNLGHGLHPWNLRWCQLS